MYLLHHQVIWIQCVLLLDENMCIIYSNWTCPMVLYNSDWLNVLIVSQSSLVSYRDTLSVLLTMILLTYGHYDNDQLAWCIGYSWKKKSDYVTVFTLILHTLYKVLHVTHPIAYYIVLPTPGRVTKCSYTYGSHWLYVGTDKSNVLLVRVEGLGLSAYSIPWNEVAEM